MSFCFESADGGVSEFSSICDLETARLAVEEILAQQGVDEPVWADQADADGVNEDGLQCWRLLVWASESDAQNDSGATAIGQLSWIDSEGVA